MIASAELLSHFERCCRAGYWSRDWRRHKMSPTEMLSTAVRRALIEDDPDPGERAGEHMVTLAAARGLDVDSSINLYRCAINHAAIANIVVTAIRQNGERWIPSVPLDGWDSSVMMSPDGRYLRRFLAVSHWSADRAFYEKHSWYALGEIAHYKIPMQLVVAVLGPISAGRRHSHWSKALLHPYGSELRFRLRKRAKVEGFTETWRPVYREEHDEIERSKWLSAMMADDVLDESLFVVDLPVPEEAACREIRELARRQLDALNAITSLPEKQLSTCHNPIMPCAFRASCWAEPESTPEYGDYDRIS